LEVVKPRSRILAQFSAGDRLLVFNAAVSAGRMSIVETSTFGGPK
jgi:hypothetical protein